MRQYDSVRGYNLKTQRFFQKVTTKISSGGNCISFHLPKKINGTDSNVPDELPITHMKGF